MTTQRAAVVDANGLVVNVILYQNDSPFDPGEGFVLHDLPNDSPVSRGWENRDGEWCAPDHVDPLVPLVNRDKQLQAQLDELLDLILLGEL